MSDRRQRRAGTAGREDAMGRSFSPRFFLSAAAAGTAPSQPGWLPGPALAPGPHTPLAPALDPVPGSSVRLSSEDSYHALKVLRLRTGDECEVVVRPGKVYRAVVDAPVSPLQLTIVAPLAGAAAGPAYRCEVGLVQALARPAVMDYVLEKGTEVGADFFLLAQTYGSPRHSEAARPDRLERWARIAQEAAKQSKQTRLPWLASLSSPEEALRVTEAAGMASLVLDPGAERLLSVAVKELGRPRNAGVQDAACPADGDRAAEREHDDAADAADGAAAPGDNRAAAGGCSPAGPAIRVALWIGPEGGWSASERDAFSAKGISAARLGRSVLRTETAGPVAVAIARLALDDW